MIYPQAIFGKFRKLKDYSMLGLLFIYFGSSWIRWDRGEHLPNQAILMDLPNRKAYLFSIEIWPDELYYITGLLIIAAIALFFVTSLFGRIWCGYTCPHTVFVDLFLKVEHYFQGDRNARIKLDQQPMDKEKFKKKFSTHITWLIIGFSFAFGWVCYFYNAPKLIHDILHLQVTAPALSWLIGLTLSTYLFAGWVRERVCTYMCPYGRFQSAMLDNNSNVVTYHDWRGEPRGNPKNSSTGDCIDCGKCVVVCPMGIDIRNGLQMACIGCGLCVDACNSVMERIGKPLDLISYESITSTEDKKKGHKTHKKIFSLKTIIFIQVLIIVSGFTLHSLINKSTFRFDVLRDREALFTILPDGSIRNIYTLKMQNRRHEVEEIHIKVSNLPNAKIKTQGEGEIYLDSISLSLEPEQELEIKTFLKTDIKTNIKQKEIAFELVNGKNEIIQKKQTVFYFR